MVVGGLGGLALVDLNRISDVQIPPRYTTVISTLKVGLIKTASDDRFIF